MRIGFGSFLGALIVAGIGFGASFGAGAVYGKSQRPATVAATVTPGAAVGGPGAGGGGGFAGAGGGGGAQAVGGMIESVTPTSIVVRQPSGTAVTITVNDQTVVRRTETGTVQDLRAGTQVLVAPDAAMVATSVQIVAPGAGGQGVGGLGGARAGATGTPGARPGGQQGTPAR